jgi:hypothetical protein
MLEVVSVRAMTPAGPTAAGGVARAAQPMTRPLARLAEPCAMVEVVSGRAPTPAGLTAANSVARTDQPMARSLARLAELLDHA